MEGGMKNRGEESVVWCVKEREDKKTEGGERGEGVGTNR